MASPRKNVVLLSDGTGNSAATVWRTNVWRLFESLDLRESDQVAFYCDGVGTSSFKPLAILGGAFGWGLKRNVLDLYRFLCRNHGPDVDVFAFGFSRGAFTVRVLIGLVVNQGLVPYRSEADLHRHAKAAYRAYRRERHHSVFRVESVFRAIRDAAVRAWDVIRRRPHYDPAANVLAPDIRFVGLWDTVAAYGLPIEEMTRGVSQWLWPLELPDRKLSPKVRRACHALALDDERTTFRPVLWTERDATAPKPDREGRSWAKDERVSQVWLPGVHANVGGGYPDDSLAQVALWWIMCEAEACGLRFKRSPHADPDALRRARSAADKDGRLYDSRHGLAGYYRYGPRKIEELCHARFSRGDDGDNEVTVDRPKIHVSAIDRIVNGAHAYAPIGFPARYAVVDWSGEILAQNPRETASQAAARARQQEHVWDLVWKRRVAYFMTVAASSYLALFPLLWKTDRAAELSSPLRPVSEAVRLGFAFLPGFMGWWGDAFASNPGPFLVVAAAVVALMTYGVQLGARITDDMRVIWSTVLAGDRPAGSPPTGWIYRLRTNPLYRSVIRAMKRDVVPLVSVAALLYVGVALASQVLFRVADAAGAFCRETDRSALRRVEVEKPREAAGRFDAASLCWPTGLELERGRRYRITISEPKEWKDRTQAAGLDGFEIGELDHWTTRVRMFSLLPLRRVLGRPWFRPIARIGAVGADIYPLDRDGLKSDRELAVDIRARRDGELFLYVNDAVIGMPGLTSAFYRHNSGTARVVVERLGRR